MLILYFLYFKINLMRRGGPKFRRLGRVRPTGQREVVPLKAKGLTRFIHIQISPFLFQFHLPLVSAISRISESETLSVFSVVSSVRWGLGRETRFPMMELSKGTTFLPKFRVSRPYITCPLCKRFRVSASFGGYFSYYLSIYLFVFPYCSIRFAFWCQILIIMSKY